METDKYLFEEWRDIHGYEGLYQVSNFGRVKNCVRKTLKQIRTSENGYSYVILYKRCKPKLHLVHRLVAEAFIPNPYNLPQVNHKDENKLNNVCCNLEWCTAKYNINYGEGILKRSAIRSKKICQMSRDGKIIRTWSSANEVKRVLGFSQGNIQQCCVGKRKTANGYIWKYA